MLEQFFLDMEKWPISMYIGGSLWIFPVVQAFHLVAVALFIGAILMINLRMLGAGFKEQPLAKVARDARPWIIWGFLFIFVTGLPQLMQNASREYYSEFFWMKMEFLAAGLILTAITLAYMSKRTNETRTGVGAKLTGLLALGVWAGVVIPARLIGLFS
jgi:hypothetical protein